MPKVKRLLIVKCWLCLTFLLVLALSVFSIHPIAASQHKPGAVPSVDFRCPSYPVSGSSPITLHTDIRGTEDPEILKPIVFKWRLSPGVLVSGQGTRRIVVGDFKEEKTVIDVKVDLNAEGGPPEMVREQSCNLRVNPTCSLMPLVDQYGGIPLAEEQKHLDRLAARLKEGPPESIAYIIAYAGKNACIYETSWRADRAREYLIEKHHLESNRVVAVEGGFRESWSVDVFVQPTRDCGPLPTPSLTRTQVRVKGRCSD